MSWGKPFKKGHIPWIKGRKIFIGKDNPFYGKTHSKETIEKIRKVHLGRKHTPEAIEVPRNL